MKYYISSVIVSDAGKSKHKMWWEADTETWVKDRDPCFPLELSRDGRLALLYTLRDKAGAGCIIKLVKVTKVSSKELVWRAVREEREVILKELQSVQSQTDTPDMAFFIRWLCARMEKT